MVVACTLQINTNRLVVVQIDGKDLVGACWFLFEVDSFLPASIETRGMCDMLGPVARKHSLFTLFALVS